MAIKEPKGRRSRSVPRAPTLAAELRARRAEVRGRPDDLLFAGPSRFDQLNAVVVAAAKGAGLQKHVHPHPRGPPTGHMRGANTPASRLEREKK